MKKCATLATLLALTMSVAVTRAASQIPAQNIQTAGLSLQAEKPPHVDAEPSPADRDLERTIKDALGQDPHMAYSRVNVHVDDKAVVLGGVVLTQTAKKQAAKIAREHAAGRKVTNRLRVNANTNPGPGL